jgi:hypothetical protein
VAGFSLDDEDSIEPLAVIEGPDGFPLILGEWKRGDVRPANGVAACYPVFASTNTVSDARALRKMGVQVDDVVDQGSLYFFRFCDPDANMLEA